MVFDIYENDLVCLVSRRPIAFKFVMGWGGGKLVMLCLYVFYTIVYE